MLSTVAGQQPRSAPIDCLERPTAVIRMIVALRRTLTSMVENRSLSNASQSSGRSFHAAMTSSVQLRETDQLHEVYKKTNYRPMYYPYALSRFGEPTSVRTRVICVTRTRVFTDVGSPVRPLSVED